MKDSPTHYNINVSYQILFHGQLQTQFVQVKIPVSEYSELLVVELRQIVIAEINKRIIEDENIPFAQTIKSPTKTRLQIGNEVLKDALGLAYSYQQVCQQEANLLGFYSLSKGELRLDISPPITVGKIPSMEETEEKKGTTRPSQETTSEEGSSFGATRASYGDESSVDDDTSKESENNLEKELGEKELESLSLLSTETSDKATDQDPFTDEKVIVINQKLPSNTDNEQEAGTFPVITPVKVKNKVKNEEPVPSLFDQLQDLMPENNTKFSTMQSDENQPKDVSVPTTALIQAEPQLRDLMPENNTKFSTMQSDENQPKDVSVLTTALIPTESVSVKKRKKNRLDQDSSTIIEEVAVPEVVNTLQQNKTVSDKSSTQNNTPPELQESLTIVTNPVNTKDPSIAESSNDWPIYLTGALLLLASLTCAASLFTGASEYADWETVIDGIRQLDENTFIHISTSHFAMWVMIAPPSLFLLILGGSLIKDVCQKEPTIIDSMANFFRSPKAFIRHLWTNTNSNYSSHLNL